MDIISVFFGIVCFFLVFVLIVKLEVLIRHIIDSNQHKMDTLMSTAYFTSNLDYTFAEIEGVGATRRINNYCFVITKFYPFSCINNYVLRYKNVYITSKCTGNRVMFEVTNFTLPTNYVGLLGIQWSSKQYKYVGVFFYLYSLEREKILFQLYFMLYICAQWHNINL